MLRGPQKTCTGRHETGVRCERRAERGGVCGVGSHRVTIEGDVYEWDEYRGPIVLARPSLHHPAARELAGARRT